jgi:outer membrane protein assembly factor BamB
MTSKAAWNYILKGKRNVQARPPVVAGDRLYQVFNFNTGSGSNGILACFDAASGVLVWERSFEFVTNEPVISADGTLYVTTFDGSSHALNLDGKLRWSVRPTEANVFKPILVGNALLYGEIGGGSKHTWCLDAESGDVRWKHESGGHAYSLSAVGDRVVHSVAPRGENGARVLCLSVADGRRLWSGESAEYVFKPVIVGPHVHVGAFESLRTHDLASGAELARFSLPGVNLTSELLSVDEGLVFGDETGNVRSLCFEGRQWTQRWERQGIGDSSSRPAIMGNSIAIHSKGGYISLLDAASGAVSECLKFKADGGTGGVAFASRWLFAAHERELRCYLQS